MNSHQAHEPGITYSVVITDQITQGLAGGDGRHYESPPQSEHQARSLVAILGGGEHCEHHGPWRQAIAGGQRIIELRAEQ